MAGAIPKVRSVRRGLAIASGLWALVAGAAAFACTGGAYLQITPAAVRGGQAISVTGSGGFATDPAASPVEVRLDSRNGTLLWSGRPDPGGALPLSVVVPELEPGYHFLIATQFDARGERVSGTPARVQLEVLGLDAPLPSAVAPAPAPEPSVTQVPATPAPAPAPVPRVDERPAAAAGNRSPAVVTPTPASDPRPRSAVAPAVVPRTPPPALSAQVADEAAPQAAPPSALPTGADVEQRSASRTTDQLPAGGRFEATTPTSSSPGSSLALVLVGLGLAATLVALAGAANGRRRSSRAAAPSRQG